MCSTDPHLKQIPVSSDFDFFGQSAKTWPGSLHPKHNWKIKEINNFQEQLYKYKLTYYNDK